MLSAVARIVPPKNCMNRIVSALRWQKDGS